MSLEPLKKELESIDRELETAMLQLSETTQRVDDILADFNGSDTPVRERKPSLVLRAAEEPTASAESEDTDELDTAPDDDSNDDSDDEAE